LLKPLYILNLASIITIKPFASLLNY